MSEDYILGCDVLGATVSIPSVGATYHDPATVLLVQQALTAKGFKLYKGIDGVYGTDTAQAIRAMQVATGVPPTGVIDYGVLAALGVQTPSKPAPVPVSTLSPFARGLEPVKAQVPEEPTPSFLLRPAFGGMRVWQVGALGVAFLTLASGLVIAVKTS